MPKITFDFFEPPSPSNNFDPTKLATQIKLVDPSWREIVSEWYFHGPGLDLNHFLISQQRPSSKKSRNVILPDHPLKALYSLSLEKINVVALGDEPSHIGNIADGLAFSSNIPQRYSTVIRAIRDEIANDLGVMDYGMSDLNHWVESGVLLLNCVLTVNHKERKSHTGIGWEQLIDKITNTIASDPTPRVFLLWGAVAQQRSAQIERLGNNHLIIKSDAPDSIISKNSFVNSKPFSKTNSFLKQYNKTVDWIRPNPATSLKSAHLEELIKRATQK